MRAFIRVSSNGKRLRTYGGNRSRIKNDFETMNFLLYSNWKSPVFFEKLSFGSDIKLELVYKSRAGNKKVIDKKYIKNLKVLN